MTHNLQSYAIYDIRGYVLVIFVLHASQYPHNLNIAVICLGFPEQAASPSKTIEVYQHLRDSNQRLPYFIATHSTLQVWEEVLALVS